MKKNKIEQLIVEDLVNHETSNGSSGQSWQNSANNVRVSLIDILKIDRNEMGNSGKVIPYQTQNTLDKILMLADQADSIKDDFVKAYSNPMIKEDDRKREMIKGMIKDINAANESYKKIAETLDQLRF